MILVIQENGLLINDVFVKYEDIWSVNRQFQSAFVKIRRSMNSKRRDFWIHFAMGAIHDGGNVILATFSCDGCLVILANAGISECPLHVL